MFLTRLTVQTGLLSLHLSVTICESVWERERTGQEVLIQSICCKLCYKIVLKIFQYKIIMWWSMLILLQWLQINQRFENTFGSLWSIGRKQLYISIYTNSISSVMYVNKPHIHMFKCTCSCTRAAFELCKSQSAFELIPCCSTKKTKMYCIHLSYYRRIYNRCPKCVRFKVKILMHISSCTSFHAFYDSTDCGDVTLGSNCL